MMRDLPGSTTSQMRIITYRATEVGKSGGRTADFQEQRTVLLRDGRHRNHTQNGEFRLVDMHGGMSTGPRHLQTCGAGVDLEVGASCAARSQLHG